MKQARVPTEAEFKRLAAVVSQGSHGSRNRMALMLSYLAGLRVGEIASLRWSDLLDGEGKVREQLRLSAAVTKGGHARVEFLNARLRKEVVQVPGEPSAAPCPAAAVADHPKAFGVQRERSHAVDEGLLHASWLERWLQP